MVMPLTMLEMAQKQNIKLPFGFEESFVVETGMYGVISQIISEVNPLTILKLGRFFGLGFLVR